MGPFAMSAVETVVNYAMQLKKEALRCRAFGHKFPRPDESPCEPVANGGVEYYRVCRGCKLPLIWTYYKHDHTYTARYDYPAVPGYLLKGHGRLASEERTAIREVALGVW